MGSGEVANETSPLGPHRTGNTNHHRRTGEKKKATKKIDFFESKEEREERRTNVYMYTKRLFLIKTYH